MPSLGGSGMAAEGSAATGLQQLSPFDAPPVLPSPMLQSPGLGISLGAMTAAAQAAVAAPAAPKPGKQKKPNPLGHTAKEKMRRASIVNSCNAFRTLIPLPQMRDADKATIFRLSVEYLAFLRTRISDADLQRFDEDFAVQKTDELLEPPSLDKEAVVPAGAAFDSSRIKPLPTKSAVAGMVRTAEAPAAPPPAKAARVAVNAHE